tara:strand:- start:174 stop:356 length:183 start_codon:yes stop_codon:yes gene_type:complete
MNQSEELCLKLQKVNLAIAEVEEQNSETVKQKKLKLLALSQIKNAIILKGKELNIDLEAA